jgi:hypothetical protein
MYKSVAERFEDMGLVTIARPHGAQHTALAKLASALKLLKLVDKWKRIVSLMLGL